VVSDANGRYVKPAYLVPIVDAPYFEQWRDAACAGSLESFDDPEIHPQVPVWRHRRAVQAALDICDGCPVKEACYDHAVLWRETGVRGGTVDVERAPFLRPGGRFRATMFSQDAS
jgi:hypothetical protein